LKYLNLKNTRVSDATVYALVNNCLQLETLILSRINYITSTSLTTIAKSQVRLNELNIVCGSESIDAALHDFIAAYPCLKKLKICENCFEKSNVAALEKFIASNNLDVKIQIGTCSYYSLFN